MIIENKLDDSGRDVVWQALKYAGYCANLRQESVVEIFQMYLDLYDRMKNVKRQMSLRSLWDGKA